MLILLPCVVLAGCSGNDGPAPTRTLPPRPGAPTANLTGDICDFSPRKPPNYVAYEDATGAAWLGDIKASDYASLQDKWSFGSQRYISSAVAAPRVSQYRARVTKDCYDASTKKYYRCSQVIVADVSKIRGLARAVEVDHLDTTKGLGRQRDLYMKNAELLAQQICEQQVRKVVGEKLEVHQEGYDLKCRTIETKRCRLPEPPAKPAKK